MAAFEKTLGAFKSKSLNSKLFKAESNPVTPKKSKEIPVDDQISFQLLEVTLDEMTKGLPPRPKLQKNRHKDVFR
jgi:hypothetical protein